MFADLQEMDFTFIFPPPPNLQVSPFLSLPRTVNHSERKAITREIDECEVKTKPKGNSVQPPGILVGRLLLHN